MPVTSGFDTDRNLVVMRLSEAAVLVTSRSTDFHLLRMSLNILKLMGSIFRIRISRIRDGACERLKED